MTKTQKMQIVEMLSDSFRSSSAIVVCHYRGLKVKHLEVLREAAKEKKVQVQVVKNTLAKISLDNAEKTGLELEGANIYIWGEDAISTSKVVSKFAKDHENFHIRSAFIEGEASGASKIEAFAKLLDREELLGMLANVWTASVRNFACGLDALKTQKLRNF